MKKKMGASTINILLPVARASSVDINSSWFSLPFEGKLVDSDFVSSDEKSVFELLTELTLRPATGAAAAHPLSSASDDAEDEADGSSESKRDITKFKSGRRNGRRVENATWNHRIREQDEGDN
jgi:hypothetical protein